MGCSLQLLSGRTSTYAVNEGQCPPPRPLSAPPPSFVCWNAAGLLRLSPDAPCATRKRTAIHRLIHGHGVVFVLESHGSPEKFHRYVATYIRSHVALFSMLGNGKAGGVM
eukprot:9019576-Lingulodinium_polyedra.AAC.1